MIIIKHRVNSIEDLKKTSNKYGVEIDLRSYGQQIIVDHEPFRKSITFIKWLRFYKHKFLILNVKNGYNNRESSLNLSVSASTFRPDFLR